MLFVAKKFVCKLVVKNENLFIGINSRYTRNEIKKGKKGKIK